MKIQILQENLVKALSRTGRIISTKTQLPILQNVQLITDEGMLRVTATNMETTVSCSVGAKEEKEGGLCVSSKLLTELVLSLPSETVILEDKGGALTVSTTRMHAVLPGIPSGEFPPIQLLHGKHEYKFEKDFLKKVFGKVLFAAATDEGRPILTGVKITYDKGDLTLAATDGYRLSFTRAPYEKGELLNMVVPARSLGEVYKVIGEEKDGVVVSMSKTEEGLLLFSIGDTKIVTRLIDGEYPNYEKIIPKSHTTRMRADANIFTSAVKSASIFARDNANIVKLHLEEKGATVSANTPQVGQNTVDVDATVEGEGGDIAFNSRFLLDFLNNFDGEEIVFEMTGSLNPGVFKATKNDTFLHIIMPVRVQG
jgi:DNA polymerase-3 subunit beta